MLEVGSKHSEFFSLIPLLFLDNHCPTIPTIHGLGPNFVLYTNAFVILPLQFTHNLWVRTWNFCHMSIRFNHSVNMIPTLGSKLVLYLT